MIKEDGTIVFEGAEQDKLNQIVEERLARERGKYADYEDLKGIDEELKAFGYDGTPKERREAIKSQREAAAKANEVEELQRKANEDGTTPALQAKIDKLEKQLSDIVGERTAIKQAEEIKTKNQQLWDTQFKEFTEAFPNVDGEILAGNDKFKKFVKGKALPLKELYEDFMDFIGETETEAIKKALSKVDRSTGVGKGSSTEGSSYGLTSKQLELAKENGIPLKDYAESLKLIRK